MAVAPGAEAVLLLLCRTQEGGLFFVDYPVGVGRGCRRMNDAEMESTGTVFLAPA